MNYKNAAEILPADLLEELQKYTEGTIIYIPKSSRREAWGLKSGIRDELDQRNASILAEFEAGKSVGLIANHYFMSEAAVKKIVYERKTEKK
ncbi:CD3324 family protein [Fusibacter ferrireducens]|uniref:Mor transcription activator domain-containing protein n=1 Tax=Fusibacter ferrireducens TaxID=2785058 RepID=A0ABR9ZMY0_9FIRM|nr:CD3324 family protein [Fusibacter ferrireducens]MBF4691823.1 hypothetical protein [Fusibacter ferrireducens]